MACRRLRGILPQHVRGADFCAKSSEHEVYNSTMILSQEAVDADGAAADDM